MEFNVTVLSAEDVNHNVRRIRTSKPVGYSYTPGQATEIAINKPGLQDQKRPFTFTSLNKESYLEFYIKCYPAGLTSQVRHLREGDELIVSDPWGVISYRGLGYFLAGGAGLTPFLAIFRGLAERNELSGNKLFFSNRTAADVFCSSELQNSLGSDVVFLTSRGFHEGFQFDRLDAEFLSRHVDDYKMQFYICGPDKMVSDLQAMLLSKGVRPDALIFEQ